MVQQYVTKVHRQHTTHVTSVPVAVREQLVLKAGDYLLWFVDPASPFVQLCKVVQPGVKNVRAKRNSDRKDKGGRT